MEAVIAVDLGGTLLRVAAVSAAPAIVRQTVQPVGDDRGNALIADRLRRAVAEVFAGMRQKGAEPVGVGLAVPGLVDAQAGVVRYSANLDLRDFPVRTIVQEVVPCPVLVENDVRAAAWGEFHWGAGRGAQEMVYLSAGTGIAAAFICGGRLYRGSKGASGELGHVPVVPDGEPCRCGGRGCLETVAGGWGIAQRAARRVGSKEILTAEQVFAAAASGDLWAVEVIREAGEFLGRAAVLLVRLTDPERLVLGGGLFSAASPLVESVRQAVRTAGLTGQTPPAVERGALERDAGLMGAAGLVLVPP
ncbi:MAG: ROK family protein [Armatimonadota bacterium]|nr:ROK family protein [Armatimonadota bacterium]MDR7451553.1 ROK family protein [Armatimonadota bacterium]MDR7467520.1 ROK family protein [Armatimonadota bacterium]MDR7494394.1 ROK family protein [Armatimonadota bacterium]MDR7499211.1 ROK family protein [Armatimonadota bacterium]